MPFVQRVVQPIHLAQVAPPVAGKSPTKFQCIPGKCKNNNCINNQSQQQKQQLSEEYNNLNESHARAAREHSNENNSGGDGDNDSRTTLTTSNVKDITQQSALATTATTTTITRAIIHASQQQNGGGDDATSTATIITTNAATTDCDATDHNHLHHLAHNHTNGFTTSFSYTTDTEEDTTLTPIHRSSTAPLSPSAAPAAVLSMKKLKQHVEFLSTAPSPARSSSRSGGAADTHTSRSISSSSQHHQHHQQHQQQQQQQQRTQRRAVSATRQSPTAAKIISGYEFDSISNITLSNALRQLASLVLIASDIFDELQRELQSVGDRACIVQRKIITVEQRVCAYDPKMVTVPESDLLTFAQRKTHYESDNSFRKELFTTETRPRSVRVLYDDAGKITPPRPSSAASASTIPHSTSFTSDGIIINGVDGLMVDAGALTADGSDDELVCTPVFGKANRKMQTRIDAEIEIRLPAAIEDLRKWTSSEALGDVTVTPDCMHHVDTSISTSMVIGDNGVLTPALSPSVLSADAVDALYSINVSNAVDNSQLPNDINKDVPLNHRLPSPEEQCKIIALRYPAEVISVDTSGKRFQRMCMARKSTTGCFTNIADANNLNDDVQTVSRRSRSRKVRGKRRNTIAGIDQKEIQDAANGDSTAATSGEIKNTLAAASSSAADAANDENARRTDKSKKFGRSKSSDILKKDSVALPYDKGKSTLTRLNSLKQWGRNRFKFMQRNDSTLTGVNCGLGDGSGGGGSHETTINSSLNTSIEKAETNSSSGVSSTKTIVVVAKSSAGGGDIDDECVVHELISQKSESRFSHERKPSYSSSEKSVSVSSSGHLKGKLHLATCGNVKLRDTSSLNRQRRNGISANGLGGKDEQPHSSSGNWSASSESGRASIGSEITIQPKSSASNTSLNVSSFHPGSGPPSSMMSRRRFLNTSASSSVTSEGTATPDLQVADGTYPNHLDDETSSAYSCDTEGYYTSFHMDSGLRTLKEEEPPMTPLQRGQILHTSNYSFGSQSNQTVLTAENEYELFGRGSTSTTTSSAGTVCTTLMVNGEQSSLHSIGPDVPERISSLGKLNKSNHSNSASSSTLERSYSSSTIGSTLERTGTIKRNVNAGLKLATAETEDFDGINKATETPESQDDEFNFDQRIRKRSAQPLPGVPNFADMEYSECSDLEGVERIERIKQKTALNAKRIPSMCIITPTTSDDENQAKDGAFDPNKTLTNESFTCAKAASQNSEASVKLKINEVIGYCTVDAAGNNNVSVTEAPVTPTKRSSLGYTSKDLKRSSNYGFNSVFEKLKVVLPTIKRSPGKSLQPASYMVDDDELYDIAGEYVTIADISNNNRHNQLQAPKAVGASSLGIYYSNDIIRRKLEAAAATTTETATKGNEPIPIKQRETEYISLNELPLHLRKIGSGGGSNAAMTNATFGTINNDSSSASPIIGTSTNDNKQRLQQQTRECAESERSTNIATVPMYAEIGEVREEKSLISPLSLSQNKGAARVRLNAQGKIIYDSDSLKRRKGAHTTFAPGPYVKETESALPEIVSNDTATATAATEQQPVSGNGESSAKTVRNLVAKTANAKLLFLNGGVAATRKVANVRPIVASSPLSQQTQRQPMNNNHNANVVMSSAPSFIEQHVAAYNYQENKNILANHTNPFFQPNIMTAMMPSPSTKSTSSTGSTISSTTSTNTSGGGGGSSSSTSSSSKEEGFQHFYKSNDEQLPQQQQQTRSNIPTAGIMKDATHFQRNTPIYWTLQNRRQPKPQSNNATSRDDLYATPIRRSERAAAAAARAAAAATTTTAVVIGNSSSYSNMSPIVPRNRNGFQTSTPTTRGGGGGEDSQLPADNIPSKQRNTHWEDNSPERFNTCSDRIGHSKTSLMDFKKLLLAKSAKTSPVQKKFSAVELLKKANDAAAARNNNATSNDSGGSAASGAAGSSTQTLNTSMKLLDLSGSPKTFANRRMLRQGQFGSPSKSFAPKLKSSPVAAWRNNGVQRTDIMSTTIPEANSEEDHSNTSGSNNGSKASSEAGDTTQPDEQEQRENALTAQQRSFDLKRNFFLQTEENNFMRGELKPTFGKGTTAATSSANTNKYVAGALGEAATATVRPTPLMDKASKYVGQTSPAAGGAAGGSAGAMPALETAL